MSVSKRHIPIHLKINRSSYSILLIILMLIPSSQCFVVSTDVSSFNLRESNVLISSNQFMQPYTFEFIQKNGDTFLGVIWTDTQNDTIDCLKMKSFDGNQISNDLKIADAKNNHSILSPRAISTTESLFIIWMEIDTLNNLHILINKNEGTNISNNIREIISNHSFVNGSIPQLSCLLYKNEIFIFWTEGDVYLYYAKYDLNSDTYSAPKPIYETAINNPNSYVQVRPLNLQPFIRQDEMYLQYFDCSGSLNPEPYVYLNIVHFNETVSNIINITTNSGDLLNRIPWYQNNAWAKWESINCIELLNTTVMNYPPQAPESKYNNEWTIKIFDNKKNELNYSFPLQEYDNVTRSFIYPVGNSICIAYVNNNSQNYEELKCIWFNNQNYTNSSILDNSFFCDYDPYHYSPFHSPVFKYPILTKSYLSLQGLKNNNVSKLVCTWLIKSDKVENQYILKYILIETFIPTQIQFSSNKNYAYTREPIVFVTDIIPAYENEYRYYYLFGDGNETGWIDDKHIDHEYSDDGIYIVKLRVKNKLGIYSDWFSLNITILNRIPFARIAVSNNNPQTFEDVKFYTEEMYDLDGCVTRYEWQFGDTESSNNTFAIHNYSDNGKYNASFVIVDNDGGFYKTSINITVQNRFPILILMSNINQSNTLQEISFYSDESYDVDGIIKSRFWDFGDNTSSLEINPTHVYYHSGYYSITFTAIDNDGGSNSTRLIVLVKNQLPVADMDIFPLNGTIFTNFEFTPKCTDWDGTISEYHWDFGDNTSSNTINPNHIYTLKGTFWVNLFVIDNEGAISNITRRQVVVDNIPPLSEFRPSSTNVSTYEKIDFLANATDPDGYIGSFIWDFGDNTTGIGPNITHEYQDNGIYNITLKVVDNDLAENTTTLQINVNNRAPSIGAKFKSRVVIGERIILDSSNSTDRDGRIVSWHWTVEGKVLEGQIINHSFQRPGKQIVKLTITDDDGAVTEQTYEIRVLDARVDREANLWIIWAVLILVGAILVGLWIRMDRKNKI